MLKNLELTNGLIYSQKVLLELAKKGLKRQEAYELVQASAMRTWKEKIPFQQSLLDNKEVMIHFKTEELNALFNHDVIFRNIDFIFDRCGI